MYVPRVLRARLPLRVPGGGQSTVAQLGWRRGYSVPCQLRWVAYQLRRLR